MSVLVIGQNPSRRHGESPALRNLYRWLTWLSIRYFSVVNLYDDYDMEKLANLNENDIKRYDKVIALGSLVSKHLEKQNIKHFKLPHPSPLNRQLNDKKYVHDQLEKCHNYLHDVL